MRLRFQYSLASLMWLTIVVACLAAMFAMYCRLDRADAEVRHCRDQTGYLEISDPKLIHARLIPITSGKDRRSWRIYLPEGRRFSIRCITEGIVEKGLPQDEVTHKVLEPGEQVVDLVEGVWETSGKAYSASLTQTDALPSSIRQPNGGTRPESWTVRKFQSVLMSRWCSCEHAITETILRAGRRARRKR